MTILILAPLWFSIAYTLFAAVRSIAFRNRRPAQADNPTAPITIAKPLCGLEPELEENLRSFCDQDYPEFEVVFAVASAGDPAAEVARRVMRPGDRVIVAAPLGGTNEKVNSLIAIEQQTTSPILVVADSDIRVGRDYLRTIVSGFADSRVAGVTALYTGRAFGSAASRLGAMYINESFLPSVLVATAIQPLDFFLGATMAVRRDALREAGGFAALAHDLADDYMLGRRLRKHGDEIRLADSMVTTTVSERTLSELLRREIRWSRTIRTVRPIGHSLTILTMPLVWAAIAAPVSITAAAAAVAARIALHFAAPSRTSWLWIPVRDALTFAVYVASFFGRRVVWRDRRFGVSPDGQLHEETARS